jgi:hypothetical protein
VSHHVESSGRRTLSNRQSRFTPAAQETLAQGNAHPWRLNSRDTVPQEKEPMSRKMQKKRHFFPDALSKENPWPAFLPVRLVYFLSGDIGLLSRR